MTLSKLSRLPSRSGSASAIFTSPSAAVAGGRSAGASAAAAVHGGASGPSTCSPVRSFIRRTTMVSPMADGCGASESAASCAAGEAVGGCAPKAMKLRRARGGVRVVSASQQVE